MFLWDDVFLEPLRDRLDGTAGSVGDLQQQIYMQLKVRNTMDALRRVNVTYMRVCDMLARCNGSSSEPHTDRTTRSF